VTDALSSAIPKCGCCATRCDFQGQDRFAAPLKDDASEVRNGMECGISISNYGDIKSAT